MFVLFINFISIIGNWPSGCYYFGGDRGGFGGGCGDHGGEIKGTRMVTVTDASSVNAGYDEYDHVRRPPVVCCFLFVISMATILIAVDTTATNTTDTDTASGIANATISNAVLTNVAVLLLMLLCYYYFYCIVLLLMHDCQ